MRVIPEGFEATSKLFNYVTIIAVNQEHTHTHTHTHARTDLAFTKR